MAAKQTRYIEAVGRRKTSVARVRISKSQRASFNINDKTVETYFPVTEQRILVRNPLAESGLSQKFSVSARVVGGGLSSQAEAVRHGVTRALVKHDPELRQPLKKKGYLKRDPRVKERKKFGLKKARRAPQWSKR
jgi:small subunit ribosomal protein S9